MEAKDLLICTREDNYLIDILQMCNCPKINEIVEVEKVVVDEDGTWLHLKNYSEDMFDANCFRKLRLEDIKSHSKAQTLQL